MRSVITRDVAAAAQTDHYDLIIVGGGIYGAMLFFEASAKGLKCLLVEQKDFGSATSFNSLRTVHGGLRYLQSLNLPRFFESVGERSWFLRAFPELVKPIGCLMPLYNDGMRRRSIMSAALMINDVLSANRNSGLLPSSEIGSASTVDAATVRSLFPAVRSERLKAGAIWHDATVPDSQRLVMEILGRSVGLGSVALNYVRADDLLVRDNIVSGISATDAETGQQFEFCSDKVVNACGPWCRETARQFDQDHDDLFHSSIAWNILFDREALSDHAVAIAPPKDNAQVYFAHPWKGRVLVGTGHGPWHGGPDKPEPTRLQIQEFIDDLNSSVPGLNFSEQSINRVFAGLLPAVSADDYTIAAKEKILNHSQNGGPIGLFSVSGVKLTTSRLVAAKTLQQIFPEKWKSSRPDRLLSRSADSSVHNFVVRAESALVSNDAADLAISLGRIVEDEAVVHLDDLVLRRTTLWEHPELVNRSKSILLGLFSWDRLRQEKEIKRLENAMSGYDNLISARSA